MSRRTKHYAPCCKWKVVLEHGAYIVYRWYALQKNTLAYWHKQPQVFLSEKKAKTFIKETVGVHL